MSNAFGTTTLFFRAYREFWTRNFVNLPDQVQFVATKSSNSCIRLAKPKTSRTNTRADLVALKVFFRGRPRRDDDKLVLLGVKQFQKLVIVGNPNWNPPQPEGAAPATTSGGAKTKLDEILDAIKPLESEAMAAVSAGSATTETQKARLQELLTQKMLQLDSVEVQGSDGREKRKRAIQSIERLCTDIENMGD